MVIKSYQIYENFTEEGTKLLVYCPEKAAAASSLLKYVQKNKRMLAKLSFAIANAENNANLNSEDLTILEAIVEEGPTLKDCPCDVALLSIQERMSHLKITLQTENKLWVRK